MHSLRSLVVIESPYAGDVETNVCYARAALLDSLNRGEAPYASHLLFSGALDDNIPSQRRQGMEAGFAWGALAEICAVYQDRGITAGMREGIDRAQANGLKVVFRNIEGWKP